MHSGYSMTTEEYYESERTNREEAKRLKRRMNEEPDGQALLSHNESRRQKHLKRILSLRSLCLAITAIVFIISPTLYWALLCVLSPTQTVLVPTAPSHSHMTLPVSEERRRREYVNNTFVQMLHQHQLVMNVTECWVCGLLPTSAMNPAPFIPLPFSRNGSCNAWYFYVTLWTIATALKGKSDNSSSRPMDAWSQLNHTCCVDGVMVNGTQMERDEYRNFNTSMRTIHKRELQENQATTVLVTVSPLKIPLCMKGLGRIWMGASECDEVLLLNLNITMSPAMVASMNSYFVCGDGAYLWLPAGWSGICYIAFLLPPVYVAPPYHHQRFTGWRMRRGIISAEDTAGQEFGDFIKGIMPFWGPMLNSRHIRQLTRVLEKTINITAGALGNITAELQADRLVTLQNRMVLDVILADRGGVCTLIGSSCCVYIPDDAPTVYQAIQKLHVMAGNIHLQEGTWSLTGWIWSIVTTWGWKILMIIALGLAVFFTCCLCLQCLPAICGICISSCIPKRMDIVKKHEHMMLQREITNIMNIDPE